MMTASPYDYVAVLQGNIGERHIAAASVIVMFRVGSHCVHDVHRI